MEKICERVRAPETVAEYKAQTVFQKILKEKNQDATNQSPS